MTFRILSFDGGGIRGVMSAAILRAVEKQLDQPLNEYFDLIAGTSTGSILASAIAMGFKSDAVINLYKENGHKIFPYTNLFSLQRLGLVMQFGLSAPKYSDQGLIEVLQNQFGNTRLSDVKSTKLLIAAYDTLSRNGIIFKSWRKDKPWVNVPLWEACVCSASAPSYFPAHKLETVTKGIAQDGSPNTIKLDKKNASSTKNEYSKGLIKITSGTGSGQTRPITSYDGRSRVARVGANWQIIPDATSEYEVVMQYSVIDGGVGANNPTACAVAEAIRILKEKPGNTEQQDPMDIAVLSIGTGSSNRTIRWEDAKGWGLIQWGWKGRLIDVVFDAPSDITDYITEQVMSVSGMGDDDDSSRYLRLQPEIVNDAMDDATPLNVAQLIKFGEEYVEVNKDLLMKFLQGTSS